VTEPSGYVFTGTGLARRQRNPGIPVIAISGPFNSGFGMDANAAIALGAARALAKPFKRRDLLRAVTDLVGPPPG